MDRVQRLATIARMLPAILKSAQSYCDASRKLSEYPREFDVLQGYALEEAAKALILLDVVRCPPRRWNHSRRIVKRAVQHLARLIYAEMVGLRPANLEEIRTYVDAARQSHYLEGDLGEFIAANSLIDRRERALYADLEKLEEGDYRVVSPADDRTFSGSPHYIIELLKSMVRLGFFSERGIMIIAEVWGKLEFGLSNGFEECSSLMQETVEKLNSAGLIDAGATQDDYERVLLNWPFPMYSLDMSPVSVSLASLEAERERILAREAGVDYY